MLQPTTSSLTITFRLHREAHCPICTARIDAADVDFGTGVALCLACAQIDRLVYHPSWVSMHSLAIDPHRTFALGIIFYTPNGAELLNADQLRIRRQRTPNR